MKAFGAIEGHIAYFESTTGMVHCKDVIVPARAILHAYNADRDRESVQANLVMRKTPGRTQLGCFDVPNDEATTLINNLKKVRKDERSK